MLRLYLNLKINGESSDDKYRNVSPLQDAKRPLRREVKKIQTHNYMLI